MNWDALIAVGTTLACLGTLIFTRVSAANVFAGALVVLLITGVLETETAIAGFANPGLLTIAALYVVAAGLRQTGAVNTLSATLFGRPRSIGLAQLRIMAPVTVLSAFINNTPTVATFVPAILDWSRKQGMSASKFLIPLSYAAIFGGTCTLIGTSTNLVVNGMLLGETGREFGFFELAWLGVPSALIGMSYIMLFSRWLLPARIPALEKLKDPREYTVEMIVEDIGPLDGRTVREAGLRQLPGLYLIEIDRDGTLIPAVGPDELLKGRDRLVFAGVTESIVDLQNTKGLLPATDQVFKLSSERAQRTLIEAVASSSANFVGRTVKESGFRKLYDAVVIAVSRNGQRINRKIGDIRLRPGDMLLLESDRGFAERHRNNRDFLLLKPLDNAASYRHERAWIAWLILAGVIVSATFGWLDILTAALAGAGAMVITRCCSGTDARRSIDLEVLIVIACAFALGEALDRTGAAHALAMNMLELTGNNPFAVLAVVYVTTVLMTEMITNNAAAVLMFPLAYAIAGSLGLNFMPFAIAITFAASASFATPIGYQTNLMVYGPGGYRFTDYIRFGAPLNIIMGVTALAIIPQVWPLT
ncbi:MAG TPA: SLC13 family permease [Gammaproteobacteria bacterium]